MKLPVRYIVIAIIVILIQGLVAKNIFHGSPIDRWAEVIIYPLLLLILPINTSASLIVVMGFIGGLCIDFFYDSPGVNASALVFTAWLRKFVLRVLQPRIGYGIDDIPLKVDPSGTWYLFYSGILLFCHILVYYALSFFSIQYIVPILINTGLTFLVSMLLINLHAILWKSFH